MENGSRTRIARQGLPSLESARAPRPTWPVRTLITMAVVLLCAACAPVKHDPVRLPPVPLSQTRVKYPTMAIRLHHEGTVTLLTLVDKTGHPADVKVELSSGYRELDSAAVQSVKDWLYKPATVDGVPIDGYVRTPINFHLNQTPPPQPISP